MRKIGSIAGLLVVAALLCGPASAQWVTSRLDDAEFAARIILDPNDIKSLLGTDFDRDYLLLEMRVRPLYNSKVVLSRDDFIVRSRRNNERSTAMSPEEIAGTAVLVMGAGRTSKSGGIFSQERDPVIIGGAPGTGTRPRTLGGQGGTFGSGGGTSQEINVNAETREATSLLGRLQQLELPIGETRETVTGYLYFQVNAKHKLKHYELTYDGNVGEFQLKFKVSE